MTNHLINEHLVEQRRTTAMADAHRHRLATSGRRGADSAAGAIPEPGSEAFRSWAAALAHAVAEHGLTGLERPVADVCASACRRGVEATCVGILADHAQPPVARERALGHVLMTLVAWSPGTAVATTDAA